MVDKLITLCHIEYIIHPEHIAPPLVLSLNYLTELRSLLFVRVSLLNSLGLLSYSLEL